MRIARTFALVILACGALGLAPVESVAPPEPGLERVEPVVEVRWQSIQATASVNLMNKQVSRNAYMNGELVIFARDRVIGVCPQVYVTEVIDPAGTNLIEKPTARPEGYFIRPPVNQNGEGGNIGVNWQVPQMAVYPKQIKKIAGATAVMIAREVRNIDFPLPAKVENPDWVSLGVGLRVKLNQCEVTPNMVRVAMDVQSPHTHPFVVGGGGGQQLRETPYVCRVRLIDDAGNSLEIPGIGGGLGPGKEARFEGRFQGSTGIPSTRVFKSMQIQVVTKAELTSVPFELTNVPFPTLEP